MVLINLVVCGPRGRMGAIILRLALQDENFKVVGVLESESVIGGQEVSGYSTDGTVIAMASSLQALRLPGDAVLIDFTSPEATLLHVADAALLGIAVVVGTTGFASAQQAALETKTAAIPILISANMSVGINVLLSLVEKVAATLADYDIEIVEMHHRMKKDAPSGTALALAEAAAAGRKMNLENTATYCRHGHTGERSSGEIGIHTVRGGDVVGDHSVIFAGPGERVEINHKASSRETFAAGALMAAKFLANQKPGLYTMSDALKLSDSAFTNH